MDNKINLCSINIALKIILRMEKMQNLNIMVFKDHYGALNEKEKEEIRNLILSRSGMSYTTFYYKLRHDAFKPLELELINNILSNRSKGL